jgi:hypothetical protein
MLMRTCLNVTETERLCYSRRKLQAISALRNAGIDPSAYGLHKDYRLPGVRGKVYLVQHPSGILVCFSTLQAIHAHAAEYAAWRRQPRLTWNEWRQMPPTEPSCKAICCWTECALAAEGLVDSQPFCRAHAFIYEQILVASGKRAS